MEQRSEPGKRWVRAPSRVGMGMAVLALIVFSLLVVTLATIVITSWL